MTETFDAIDKKILSVIQRDGRISVADLSDRVGLSSSPCMRRLKILEEGGVILRYGAFLSQDAVGLPVTAFATVKLDRRPRSEGVALFSKEVAKWPEVLECYLITGAIDFILRIVVSDLHTYERFLRTKLSRLDYVSSVESTFSLERVKWTNELPIP